MAFISVVEDDESVRELITVTLKSAGFTVNAYDRGETFLLEYDRQPAPQLILLDIMLPGIDGLEVLKYLKEKQGFQVPVVFLTARTTEIDKVTGLNSGADDYITKPFGVLELIARVNSHIRRSAKKEPHGEVLHMNGMQLDSAAHKVFIDGKSIALTFKEFELLKYFLKNEGLVLTREMLLNEIWGIDTNIETRTVDMHVKTLRKKIGNYGSHIKTVRGVGYQLEKGNV